MSVVGLDVGGVNVKAADADGRSLSQRFELWKTPQRLPEILAGILSQFPGHESIAVTMTGELADCFETKSDGVDTILAAVEETADGKPVFVWQTGAEFVSSEIAREIPLLVAAANWHALATWIGRMVPEGASILLDIGTTTTDIIPLLNGVPIPTGLTDRERLESGELVYSGIRRTPLCAIAHTVPFRGRYCQLAAELFATTLDIHLMLGNIPEDPADLGTANGKPATKAAAHDRLARMVCCDRTEFTQTDADRLSYFLANVQKQRIAGPLDRVLSRLEAPCKSVLISGAGAFLARRVVRENPRLREAEVISLDDSFSATIAESACAFAVARLASERISQLV